MTRQRRAHFFGGVFLSILLVFVSVVPATAGQSCRQKAPSVAMVTSAAVAAKATYQALEKSGAQVAIVGRIGADVSKHGLRYTHAAFAMRNHPKGRWLLRHQLNICATDSSVIFDQALLNFFLDDPFAYDALVVIPKPRLAQRLEAVVLSPTARALHTSDYSMIAHPFSTRYQNSNQWLLELIAAAEAPVGGVTSRTEAQAHLRHAGFRPSRISLSGFEVLGASLFRANIRFGDHDASAQQSGRYEVVSVESVRDYLAARGQLREEFVVRHTR